VLLAAGPKLLSISVYIGQWFVVIHDL
jgi:hypothetical protein